MNDRKLRRRFSVTRFKRRSRILTPRSLLAPPPQARKEAKKKRKERRSNNLSVMEDLNTGSSSLTIERERTLKRIATRGVVALFNAIATHQYESKKEDSDSEEEDIKTKKGFIDKLKNKAVSKVSKKEEKEEKTVGEGSEWMKDDYMQKSKLKDWDKDDSSDEDEVPDFVKDGDEDLGDAKEYDEKVVGEKKKREAVERKERKDKSKEEAKKNRAKKRKMK